MKSQWIIKPAFSIPGDYRRTFAFEVGGFEYWIWVRNGRIVNRVKGSTKGKDLVQAMDWCGEMLEQVRWECERLQEMKL